MKKKTIFIPLLVVAVIIPILSVSAINEVDIDIMVKERINEMIKEQRDELDKVSLNEREELLKKIAGLEDFKDVLILGEQIQQANEDDKEELIQKLDEKLEELKRHAGDRYSYTILTPSNGSENVSTQMIGIQTAYATNGLSDFEFGAQYNSCWGWNYDMEVAGFVDTNLHLIDVSWNAPNHMYVGSWPCDFTEYDRAILSHYAIDDDAGFYYCAAAMPNFSIGAAVYTCPFASSGDLTVMSSTVHYDGDDESPNIHLSPYVKVMLLD